MNHLLPSCLIIWSTTFFIYGLVGFEERNRIEIESRRYLFLVYLTNNKNLKGPIFDQFVPEGQEDSAGQASSLVPQYTHRGEIYPSFYTSLFPMSIR